MVFKNPAVEAGFFLVVAILMMENILLKPYKMLNYILPMNGASPILLIVLIGWYQNKNQVVMRLDLQQCN